MIARIYNKGLSILNAGIGKLHMFLEHKHVVNPLKHELYLQNGTAVNVQHRLPLNFLEADQKLFDHYTNYSTCNEEVFELHNVNVTSEGIVFKGANNFAQALPHPLFRARYGWLYLLGRYLFCKKVKGAPDKKYVLVYDFWAKGNYYHWLVDSLPRLMLLKDELRQKNYSFLLPEAAPKFITDTLRYFEINSFTYLKAKDYLSAPDLLVPYYLAGSGRIHPVKFLTVRDLLVKHVKGTVKKDRIYVSRGRQKTRRVSNEQDVINVLKEFNFEVVFFEGLSFNEQMELVRNTRVMVSSHGANLTNLMFMQPGAKVLELIRDQQPNFCYWALASVCGLDYYYQLCNIAASDHLQVHTDRLRQNLKLLLND